MQFTEFISIAGYTIEAVGVLVVVVGSCISSVVFIRTFISFESASADRLKNTIVDNIEISKMIMKDLRNTNLV